MNTSVKATNTSLTPLIEEYLEKRTSTLEKLISPDDTSARLAVEIGRLTDHHKSGDVFFAEFNLHIAGKDFRSRKEANDIYAAIDIVRDEMFDAIRSHKGKRATLLRRGSLMVKNAIRGFPFKRKGNN